MVQECLLWLFHCLRLVEYNTEYSKQYTDMTDTMGVCKTQIRMEDGGWRMMVDGWRMANDG